MNEMSEIDTDTDSDLEDETLNPGPWFPVLNTEEFYMPEMQEFMEIVFGPVDIRLDDKPHEIFLLLTDPENVENNVVDVLVKETNRYAEHRISIGKSETTIKAPYVASILLGRDICVDERIVGFKSRHNIVQYISKKKSHQWGAKVWVLSESDTGYTEHVQLYYGRRNRQSHILMELAIQL
ncbi:unnamed protein product [Mytilus coruscus]|uniref:PiggyBac transposable element-derived protein domain-containing protein n=1 Tax=Mytilus coruscus TaxID=42192 RepID=A0A6J8CQ66_MYTCO|nr:unnamed protein product [Mytilus coruscus]